MVRLALALLLATLLLAAMLPGGCSRAHRGRPARGTSTPPAQPPEASSTPEAPTVAPTFGGPYVESLPTLPLPYSSHDCALPKARTAWLGARVLSVDEATGHVVVHLPFEFEAGMRLHATTTATVPHLEGRVEIRTSVELEVLEVRGRLAVARVKDSRWPVAVGDPVTVRPSPDVPPR